MCADHRNYEKQSIWQSFYHELLHHFPYATMSVALALMLLTAIQVFFGSAPVDLVTGGCSHGCSHTSGYDILFHSFHFIHILFATTGTIITFRRYSENILMALCVGALSSMVFCTLSDVLLPYAAGRILGVNMDLHICFASELKNILPFLFVGIFNGWVMTQLPDFRTRENSLQLHFLHTFISAMASIFYAVGHGLSDFSNNFGLFFLLIIIAVIIPCTLSDVVSPILFANIANKRKTCKI